MNTPVLSIPLDKIIVGQRLRAIDEAYVQLLAASMAEAGQQTPIHVGPADAEGMHQLIAGAHRVAAARSIQMPALEAKVFRGTALEAELLEIDENLMRRGLSELDRAVFLAKRKEIYIAMHPETGHGGARKGQDDNLSFFRKAAFTKATAEKLGLNRRSIERAIARAKLEPDLRDMLAPTRWADNGSLIDALLRLDEATRRRAVEALVRVESPARSLADALAEVSGRRVNTAAAEADRQYAALLSAWRKAGRAARRRFLTYLAAEGETLPAAKEPA